MAFTSLMHRVINCHKFFWTIPNFKVESHVQNGSSQHGNVLNFGQKKARLSDYLLMLSNF